MCQEVIRVMTSSGVDKGWSCFYIPLFRGNKRPRVLTKVGSGAWGDKEYQEEELMIRLAFGGG